MKLLGCLFTLLLIGFFVCVATLNVLWLRIRQFLSGNTRPKKTAAKTPEAKKTFKDDEGEYVEFEETKE